MIILHNMLPQDSDEVEYLQYRVHIASVTIIVDAYKFVFYDILSLD